MINTFEEAEAYLIATDNISLTEALANVTDRTDLLDDFQDYINAHGISICDTCGYCFHPADMEYDDMCCECYESTKNEY